MKKKTPPPSPLRPCVGFKPIAAQDARILILGTLPSVESLLRRQYYAKKENAFWKIMGELTGAMPERPYALRAKMLKEKRIALWDVCARAKRAGSLDSNIRRESIVANDFSNFFKTHPKIELICFNGQPAERLFRLYALPSLTPKIAAMPRITLPSTSPAFARLGWRKKMEIWRKALDKNLY